MAEGLTLDAGALVALERRDRRVGAMIAAALAARVGVVVPTVVVVEWWRGQRGPAARLLSGLTVEPLFEPLARIAADALRRVKEGPSAVDAVVMASAAQRGDRVLTSDVTDMEALRTVFPGVRVLRV